MEPDYKIKSRESFVKMLDYLNEDVRKTENIRLAALKKRQIDVMEGYFRISEKYIQRLHEEQIKLYYQKEELNERIKSMEAICIIHGITDFPAWLAKGWGTLYFMAIDHNETHSAQLPYLFLDHKHTINTAINGTIG